MRPQTAGMDCSSRLGVADGGNGRGLGKFEESDVRSLVLLPT